MSDTNNGGTGTESPPPKTTAPEPDPAAAAALKESRAAASIGAQVILDFNGDGGLGARGGAGGDLVENQMARDAHLVSLGLDPVTTSGPPLAPEVVKAKQEAAEMIAAAQAKVSAAHATSGSGTATRVSSLAAGILTEPGDVPEPPPPDTTDGGGSSF